MIKNYTDSGSSKNYFVASPFIYTEFTDFDSYSSNDSGVIVIALSTVTGTSFINGITTMKILTSGFGIVKVSTSLPSLAPFTIDNNVNTTGMPAFLSTDGYVFNNNAKPTTSLTYFRVGYFMETGTNVSSNGKYTIIKFDPKFINYLD